MLKKSLQIENEYFHFLKILLLALSLCVFHFELLSSGN